jgi:hypothetical protein
MWGDGATVLDERVVFVFELASWSLPLGAELRTETLVNVSDLEPLGRSLERWRVEGLFEALGPARQLSLLSLLHKK